MACLHLTRSPRCCSPSTQQAGFWPCPLCGHQHAPGALAALPQELRHCHRGHRAPALSTAGRGALGFAKR